VSVSKSAAEQIAEQGYTVLPAVLGAGEVAALLDDLARIEAQESIVPASNEFEGRSTLRAYNLLRHGRRWQDLTIEPDVLGVVEQVLDPGCLISSVSSIRILPGESAQPIHADDQLLPLDGPHPAVVCNTMWALTEFTPENGATRLVPGSHQRGKPVYGGDYDTVAAELRPGDVLIWNGSLWHGGGANATDADRVGIAVNYCAGWIRQQENQQLGLPRSQVATFPARLQELVGYSVYGGLIGHIERRSPADLLDGPDS
jgi:ectoine hydroxylase-related dioxygenase (phytanoyl-CoA dioxygenase family)